MALVVLEAGTTEDGATSIMLLVHESKWLELCVLMYTYNLIVASTYV